MSNFLNAIPLMSTRPTRETRKARSNQLVKANPAKAALQHTVRQIIRMSLRNPTLLKKHSRQTQTLIHKLTNLTISRTNQKAMVNKLTLTKRRTIKLRVHHNKPTRVHRDNTHRNNITTPPRGRLTALKCRNLNNRPNIETRGLRNHRHHRSFRIKNKSRNNINPHKMSKFPD